MLHIDKFQDLGSISLILQHLSPDGVRIEGGHPFLDQAVAKYRGHQFIFHLPVQLVLAAGNRENHLGPPAHRLFKGVVRGQVAGVKGHHQIHLIPAFVSGDIPLKELQILIAVFLCQLSAMTDHILF